MGDAIKLFSVNINGLNIPRKRAQMFNKLRKLDADVICLQEVHIKKDYRKLLENVKLGTLYTTLAQNKKGGIAIYVKEKIKSKSIYSDEEGRILMLEIELEQKQILLTAVYAPNNNQHEFFKKVHKKLVDLDYESICIIGDLNAIVDVKKYYKSSKKKKKKKNILPKSFFDMVTELNLQDIWRETHRSDKQYTFYSYPHQSWSRIDMAWATTDVQNGIEEIEIGLNDWADHNPIIIKWKGQKQRKRWSMNQRLCKDKQYIQMLEKELTLFFQVNKKEETSTQNLWDTTKAYIRGLTIAYNSKKNKDRRLQQGKLQEELKKIEGDLQKDPQNKKIKEKWNIIKHKINLTTQKEMAQKIRMAKQNYFENANKTGRWLAYKLKKEKGKRTIHQLQDESGTVQCRWEEKKKIIQNFFSKLYHQEDI